MMTPNMFCEWRITLAEASLLQQDTLISVSGASLHLVHDQDLTAPQILKSLSTSPLPADGQELAVLCIS